MNSVVIGLDLFGMLIAVVLAMALLSLLSRRLLGLRVTFVRLVLASVVGLAAGVAFEAEFVWDTATYTPALIPVQIAVLVFSAVAFVVIAELAVPQGTIPSVAQWIARLRRGGRRTGRYAQISAIVVRHRLLPFRINWGQSELAVQERKRQAASVREALEEAGGAFVKLGQMLSTRTDVLPIEFTTELAKLQQSAAPAPWSDIAVIVESELGAPITTVFERFDEQPIAAASIGQLHRARLTTGEEVAVKVQRPGIIPLVQQDVAIMREVAQRASDTATWAREMGVAELTDSFARDLLDELDYRVEAGNMAALEDTQSGHPSSSRLRIPHRYAELCSERMLVMEFLEGRTLSDPRALEDVSSDVRAAFASRLLSSTLTQILDDGVFHSDLHPGNVMVTDDADLALVDFGSVGRLDSTVRALIGEVVLAFSRRDAQAFADALLGFVDLPEDLDEPALRRQIGVLMARRLGPGARIDVTAFTDMMATLSENRLAIPSELTTVFRSLASVEGSLRVLRADFDVVHEVSDYADERVRRAVAPRSIAELIGDELGALAPIVRRLPRQVGRIAGSVASGRLSVNVRLFADRRDRSLLRDFVGTIALAFLAGVFGIMSAMLLTSSAGPDVGGGFTALQVLGSLLLLASGTVALKVIYDVFRRRERP